MKNIDFFSVISYLTVTVFSESLWSRALKNTFTVKKAIVGAEKSESQGAKKGPFCMGILVTLSLSKKKAPIGLKIFFSS